MEILVPAGIFVLGIIISLATANAGLQRLLEKRGNEEELGRTAAYAAPFKDAQHEFADVITQKKK